MDATFWIIGLVVLAVLVIIAVLIIGKRRGESKTVSFEKPDEPRELTQQEKSGNYQAQGGFSFAPAKQEEKEPVLLGEQQPEVVQAPEEDTDSFPVQESDEAPVIAEEVTVEEASVGEIIDGPSGEEASVEEASVGEIIDGPSGEEASVEEASVGENSVEQIIAEPEAGTPVPTPEEVVEAAEAAQVTAESAEAALEQTPVPETEPEPAPEPLDEIAPAAGRIGKLRGRLARSQNVFGKSVLGILTAGDLDDEAWEDIEAMLIKADLGNNVTMRVVDELRGKIAANGVSNEAEARAMLRETLIDACRPDLDRAIKAMPYEGKPAVVLVVGVNGTGKTTTTGKLARVLVSMGHKVLLGAADTFRAAAADQLETWGRRVGADTVRGAEGADPASVAFDAVARGVEQQADVVLVDTAGRLHTSTGLMDQLGKVKRVVEKKAVVDEVLLVLDATVGQNGMQQARIFSEVVDITGVVLTKLDGTAKGGIVFQVQEELGVPVKLVGLGEGADDLAPFEVEGFVDALLG
ncbi:signal recognition particle-docking protein FtsY [Corynebacterium pacaense]|uniref:signal recognition particle-docking protein FtsY n=1 Tax=Corynebacterium pacaense TaxID=1816684 RepID=UPI0009BC2641|nr:signal recognition particle-docking protein FtsY [Corynebacterium pacaense]